MNKHKVLQLILFIGIIIAGVFFIFRDRGKDEDVFPPPASEAAPQQDEGQSSQIVEPGISGKFVRGSPSPDFSFSDFEGNVISYSGFSGKPVVIDFWAAWCPFCVEEMPILQGVQEKYGEELIVIGIHRTDTESIAKAGEFAKERGVSYLLGSDPNGDLYKAAGGFGMPVAVFIDKEGVVTEVKSGPKTKEEIEEKIGELLVNRQ